MTILAEALAIVLGNLQAGRLQEAEAVCRQILLQEPASADALHLLGVLAHRGGRNDTAINLIRRAVALNPENAEFHYNLGVAQQVTGQLAEAAASYRESLHLQPERAEAHNNLGYVLLLQGRLDDALTCFEQALQLRSDFVEALANRGEALLRRGELAAAADSLRHALQLSPDFPEAHNHLGVVLRGQGSRDEAEACFHQALRLRPDFGGAHNNLGRVCEDRGRLDEAAARFRLALCYQPADASIHNNLGNVLIAQGNAAEALSCYEQAARLQPGEAVFRTNLAHARTLLAKPDEAEASCRQALRLRSDFVDAHHNLAIALAAQGHVKQALASNEQALRLEPEHPEARNCRALWWLQTGDFERGWPEYEWRWKIKGVTRRPFTQPLWDGSALDGKTVLIHAEQALGDTVQFIRYAALVRQRVRAVVVECQPALMPLLRGCLDIDELVARGGQVPDCDVQVPLLSLPGVFRTTLVTMPADIPYLFADSTLVKHWRRELGGTLGFKIGIAWQGNPSFPGDKLRSIPLAHFAALACVPGVRLVSLQKGTGREQVAAVTREFAVTDLGSRLDESTGAFMDTAAVMRNLDLVVTSDTAIAHLAGALGVPVWVALSIGPDWRWLLDREDSPWYPTMRLFRQRRLHDWNEVFERIAGELRQKLLPVPLRSVTVPANWEARTRPARAKEPPALVTRAAVCILTHGDCLQYFRRCLDSILDNTPSDQFELRVGFNAAPASVAYALERLGLEGLTLETTPLPGGVLRTSLVDVDRMSVRLWHSATNLYKEPMARLMYHDVPLATEYAVWFDDDSFVERGWWQALCAVLDERVDYIGQPWWVDYLPGQVEMIRTQSWYREVPFETRDGRPGVHFMTGGFMAVRSERLREANFPDISFTWKNDTLKQYGGDTLLGEIARQLGWTRAVHDRHIQVNVDMEGHHPAPRRGGTGRQFGSDIDGAIA